MGWVVLAPPLGVPRYASSRGRQNSFQAAKFALNPIIPFHNSELHHGTSLSLKTLPVCLLTGGMQVDQILLPEG
jgi:hypothetical protein